REKTNEQPIAWVAGLDGGRAGGVRGAAGNTGSARNAGAAERERAERTGRSSSPGRGCARRGSAPSGVGPLSRTDRGKGRKGARDGFFGRTRVRRTVLRASIAATGEHRALSAPR